MIGSSIVLGLAIGAMTGGKIIGMGRLRCLIASSIIGCIGVGATLFENIYSILFGRLIYGVSIGILSVNIPRYVEETIPSHLLSIFAPIFAWT